MKRVLCMIVCMVLLLQAFPANALTLETETVRIGTLAELRIFASRVNAGESSLNAELLCDIDLARTTSIPIGSYRDSKPYRGVFNGNGYTIKNFTLNTSEAYQGLFGYLYNARIENLGVRGTIRTTSTYSGGLAGIICGNTTINNCFTDVNITYVPGGDATAGGIAAIVDNNSTLNITDTYVCGSIVTEGASIYGVGGFVGNVRWYATVNAHNCYCISTYQDYITKSSALFRTACDSSKININNCYSYNSLPTVQGKTITPTQVANGALAWNLGSKFGQEISKDAHPVAANNTNTVYSVKYIGDYNAQDFTNAWVTLPVDSTGVFHYKFSVDGRNYTAKKPLAKDLVINVTRSSSYTHLITFKNADGSVISSEYFKIGAIPVFPKVPKCVDGYEFAQWNVTGIDDMPSKAVETADFDYMGNLVLTATFTVAETRIDSRNQSGISYWEPLELSTKKMLDNGYSGDGCQWPTTIEYSDSGAIAFYGTDVAGMYRSTNGGRDWNACNTGLTSRGVNVFAIDPINEEHVLCLGNGTAPDSGGLFVSLDCGDTWTKTINFAILGARYHKDGFEFDKTSYNKDVGMCMTAYFSTPYKEDVIGVEFGASSRSGLSAETVGLYKSTDGGYEWTLVNKQMHDSIIEVNPQNGNIYAANSGGLFVSRDGGNNFTLVHSGNVTGLDMVEYNSQIRVYINDECGVWYSFDDCKSTLVKVNSINYPSADNYPKYLAVSPLNPNHMMITARTIPSNYYTACSYYSHDGGITWAKTYADASSTMYGITSRERWYSYSPTEEGVLLSFGGDTATISYDGGKTLSGVRGISNIMTGGRFSFNVYNNDIMCFGAQDYSGAITLDGGKTWNKTYLGCGNTYGGYAANESVYFGGASSGWYSTRYVAITFDAGATYTVTNNAFSQYLVKGTESSYQSPTNPDVYFCGNWRSDNGGKTWSEMDGCICVYTSNPVGNKELYGAAPCEGYVVVSYDDGLTWSRVNNKQLQVTSPEGILQVNDIAIDYISGSVYAVFQNELFKIHLDGTWVTLRNNMPASMLGNYLRYGNLKTVCVDYNNPSIVYAGGSGDYFMADASALRSCDGGTTWQVVTSNARNSIINTKGVSAGNETSCLRVMPQTGELWAASACFGFSKLTAPYATQYNPSGVVYTVDFVSNNHTNVLSQTIHAGKSAQEPFMASHAGYVFDAWYCDAQFTNKFNFTSAVNGNLTLYAHWNPAITVTFFSRGTTYASNVVAQGDSIAVPLIEPMESGYAFAGWFVDSSCRVPFDFSVPISKETNVYAGFYINLFDFEATDYAGYIAYSDHGFRPSNYTTITKVNANASVSNRTATISVEENKTYTVRLNMDCRFRVGSVKSLVKNAIVTNCTIDSLDNNTSTYIGEQRMLTHTTGNGETTLLLFYWTSVGSRDFSQIKESIAVYDATIIVNAMPNVVVSMPYTANVGVNA